MCTEQTREFKVEVGSFLFRVLERARVEARFSSPGFLAEIGALYTTTTTTAATMTAPCARIISVAGPPSVSIARHGRRIEILPGFLEKRGTSRRGRPKPSRRAVQRFSSGCGERVAAYRRVREYSPVSRPISVVVRRYRHYLR